MPAPRLIPPEELEKFSSAATLSDMEIFVFPDLLFPLVLANMMSPRLWAWRDDPWFASFPRLSPYRRILRLKQFIMDHYSFNLDLETWGLTTQARELERFAPFLPSETIAASNALFGYQGDQFYFDLDIRRHFGLDQYSRDTIPYWKTETLEAMDAFRFRPGHSRGAGECVSLSTLYAAALYVLCGIPLEDIFLLATPLHSQNFIDLDDGILTNNRRLVTKTMWFNGTDLTAKARRALEHERITIVSHLSGHLHTVYPSASISPHAYARLQSRLRSFLQTPVTSEILFNFLRASPARQAFFQIEHTANGKSRWIPAERAYAFENSCSFKVSDSTRTRLLDEMDADEFFTAPLPDRIPLNKFDDFFKQRQIDLDNADDRRDLALEFNCYHTRVCALLEELRAFCRIEPRWPEAGHPAPPPPNAPPPLDLPPALSRQQLIEALSARRHDLPMAELAFHAYRDLAVIDPRPWYKAAIERSPVCAAAARPLSDSDLLAHLRSLPPESIYDSTRAAQPDEVWNASRGDGFEKAVTLASILHARHPDVPFLLRAEGLHVHLDFDGTTHTFSSAKNLTFTLAWPL